MYTDTHCHLNFKAFNKDLKEVIDRAKKSGVEKIIIPGAKLDSSRSAVEIASQYEMCFAAVGIHPHHTTESDTSLLHINVVKPDENSILNLVNKPKVVAIGEIGLDYYAYKNYPPITMNGKKRQKELLIIQLKIALACQKPVILHCREAHDDMLELLTDFQEKPETRLRGVFHCFGGDKNHLKKVLDLGFLVGFDGNITYEDNQKLQEMVIQTPLERLLLETDAPYLAPVPYRRQRNEPSYLSLIAVFISNLTGNSLKKITGKTQKNAESLFSI